MAKRNIIEIDRDLCNGCGLCTTACAEGALQLDAEGKAVLVGELYCDGMGACLDVCPTGALKVVARNSEDYDARAAYRHVLSTRGRDAAKNVHGIGERDAERGDKTISGRSELTQWPVQLHLVSPLAPYLQNADLLVAADCTAFALGSFHQDLLMGKKLVIACPKLDDTENYVEKLSEIIKINGVKSLTVAVMTVPCCAGLHHLVEEAVERSGAPLKAKKVVIGIDGRIAV